ncbi:MAG: DMT family transporter [Chlamydiia bacterium]|nr:DMT family transporter [Chlamydiia bacterium]
MRQENTKLAITFSLCAALTYAILAYLIKTAEHFLPNTVLIFFRQLFGLMILLPLIPMKLGSFKALKTSVFSLYLLRAFSSLAAMFCLFFALRYLPLTDAVLLSYTRPLFIPIIVYFWFQSKWTKSTWIGLIMGFIGVLLILQPGKGIFNAASFIGLAAGLFGAIAFTTIRRLTRTEPSEKITFYYLALSLPMAAVPLAGSWETPTAKGWLFLVVIGCIATLYQLLLSRAYRHAKAVKVGSLLYSSVAFAYLIDIFLGNKIIPIGAILGMVLIVIGSILSLREQKEPR